MDVNEHDEGPEDAEVSALFLAFAHACADQDAAAWQALIHPRAVRVLSGPKAIVLDYHRAEAFRSPYAVKGWRLESFWESTETQDLGDFVPMPDSVARRVREMPFGLADAVSERMLATYEGRLHFALRDFSEASYGFLRQAIARQEERWAWARDFAARLPSEVRNQVLGYRAELEVGNAYRAVSAHDEIGLRRCWEVVHVLWGEAAEAG